MTSGSAAKHQRGKNADEGPKPSKRRMPQQAVDAHAGGECVKRGKRQDCTQEIEQERRDEGVKKRDLTQHGLVLP